MTDNELLLAIFDSLGKFCLTLAGTGVGALLAFRFNRRKQHLDDEKCDYADAVGVFYTLVARYSAVENFTRHYMDKRTGGIDPRHEFKLAYQPYPKEEIAVKSLVCFANKEFRQIIYDITVSGSNYFNFTDALEERNKDLRQLFDVFLTQGLHAGADLDRARVMEIPQTSLVMEQTTNLVVAAKLAKRDVARSIRDLTFAMHKRFPNHPKLSTDIPDPDAEAPTKKPGTASP